MRTDQWYAEAPTRVRNIVERDRKSHDLGFHTVLDALGAVSDDYEPSPQSVRTLADSLSCLTCGELSFLISEARRELRNAADAAAAAAESVLRSQIAVRRRECPTEIQEDKIPISDLRRQPSESHSAPLPVLAVVLQSLIWALAPSPEHNSSIRF